MFERESVTLDRNQGCVPPGAAAPAGLAVKVAAFGLMERQLRVLLSRDTEAPGRKGLALPSSRALADETPADAAVRVAHETTGLGHAGVYVAVDHQVVTFLPPSDGLACLTVAYLGVVAGNPSIATGGWAPARGALDAGLNPAHATVLDLAVNRLCGLLEHTTIAVQFLRAPFTVTDLRFVYEAAWGLALDPGNFTRHALGRQGFISWTGSVGGDAEVGRRPRLYDRGGADRLCPPLLRRSDQQ